MYILSDLSGRGSKKFGDNCEVDNECGFAGSYCEPKKKKCTCREEFETTNHLDKCGHGKLGILTKNIIFIRYILLRNTFSTSNI